MTPQRWQRVHELFEAACDLAPDFRGEFLASRCGDDEELRREVESLLRFDGCEASTLLNPTLPSVARMADPADERAAEAVELIAAQRRLGAYELLRPLASGGMSMVWLAQRADDHFRQLVAVKVIKRGLDGPDVLARFRNERQLLANLSHPNIARLLDGGVTEEGLPFLVMEYVDGKPIDRYCDEAAGSLAQRLELFRTVCAAVAYAHQSLVVHRDLKPANILVTPAGTPLLLDFGIAKVLNPTDRFGFDTVTLLGQRPMTPAYASPEQIRGRPITTASDIYSLGVILFELLTGHRPYEAADARALDYERVVCDAPAPRPSQVVLRPATRFVGPDRTPETRSPHELAARRGLEPRRLRQRLMGDLDTIVLKAMAKEPGRRYASVEQLAEDVRRHLVGLPVRARPATLGYRLGKYVARNRWSLAASTVVVATVLALVLMLWRQWHAASHERDRALLAENQAKASRDDAQQKADNLRTSNELLLNALAALSDGPAAVSSQVRDLFDRTAHQFDTAPPDDPKLEGEQRITLGRGYARLRQWTSACEQFRRAATLRLRALGPASTETATAYYELADACDRIGDWTCAEQAFRAALDAQRRAIGYRHPLTARGVNEVGELLLAMERIEEAQGVLGELYAETQRLESFAPDDLARGRLLYACVLARSDPAKASIALENLLTEERGRLGARDVRLGRIVLGLGDCRRRLGQTREAVALCEEGVALLRSGASDDIRDLALGQALLARAWIESGEHERAEAAARGAMQSLHAAGMGEHPVAAECRAALATALSARADLAAAERLFHEALAIRRRATGPRSPLAAVALLDLGACLARKGEYVAASEALREAIDIRNGLSIGVDRTAVTALEALALCYDRLGHSDLLRATLAELLAAHEELDGWDDPRVAAIRDRLQPAGDSPQINGHP